VRRFLAHCTKNRRTEDRKYQSDHHRQKRPATRAIA
jgi:hypothetical protein